jgi:YfiH family protein
VTVEVIRSAALADVPHGFLGRRGGVSTGEMAGLNVGYGSSDDRDAIARNRELAIAAVLPGAELATVHQVHSNTVVTVDRPWPQDGRPRADAMVTDRPGLLLGILTADCAPVLLADAEAGVIGAAHAGWRGALAGVTDATIGAMEALGAQRERIAAAVGPCIGLASYEVDHPFRRKFLTVSQDNDRFFPPWPPGKLHFDLEAYVVSRLSAAGLHTVEALHLDTYADAARFYSYRRSTHRGEADYGRQIAVIGLPGPSPVGHKPS